MSVRTYTLAEIGRLYADIRALKPRVLISARDEAIREALAAALVANRAAYAMTYGDETVIEQLCMPEAGMRPVELGGVFREVSLLLYNCISNGGRDSLPREDREVLEEVRLAIAWNLADAAGARPPPASRTEGHPAPRLGNRQGGSLSEGCHPDHGRPRQRDASRPREGVA